MEYFFSVRLSDLKEETKIFETVTENLNRIIVHIKDLYHIKSVCKALAAIKPADSELLFRVSAGVMSLLIYGPTTRLEINIDGVDVCADFDCCVCVDSKEFFGAIKDFDAPIRVYFRDVDKLALSPDPYIYRVGVACYIKAYPELTSKQKIEKVES